MDAKLLTLKLKRIFSGRLVFVANLAILLIDGFHSVPPDPLVVIRKPHTSVQNGSHNGCCQPTRGQLRFAR